MIRYRITAITIFCLFLFLYDSVWSLDGKPVKVNWNFETGDYSGWEVIGEAFGRAPDSSELPQQNKITGYEGKYYASSFHGGDTATGKLISPEFIIHERYLNFLIGGGNHPGKTCVNLVIGRRVERTATGTNSEELKRVIWDVKEMVGKSAHIEVVDESTEGYGYVLFDDLRTGLDLDKSMGDIEAMDLKKHQYTILMGASDRGEEFRPNSEDNFSWDLADPSAQRLGPISHDNSTTSKPLSWYGVRYGISNYDAFNDLFTKDGFNSFGFLLNYTNSHDEKGGGVYWDIHAKGWKTEPGTNQDLNLWAARKAEMTPLGVLLIGGMINDALAKEHPDWVARNDDGSPRIYFGQWMCQNSPFFDEYLLPMYRDLFSGPGKDLAAIALWEGPFMWCSCDRCKSLAHESGMEFNDWQHQNKLKKMGQIAQTIRSTGWKGKIIGAGWGAYEWEEQMWDRTMGFRNYFGFNIPEIEAFDKGIVDVIMPELYVHSTYGAHPYRREDLHFVYRSLMYERSVFGDNIIPCVELYWNPRAIEPHELFRWLLETRCAGFNSYSVISEPWLYIDNKLQLKRSSWRTIFKEFSKLPSFNPPEPNFQFVVSMDLERDLVTKKVVVMGKRSYPNAWDWYVKESNRLFKNIERTVGCGTLINNKITHLPDRELYGPTMTDTPIIIIAPAGSPQPIPPSTGQVHVIQVKYGEDLDKYTRGIETLIKQTLKHPIQNKSPLVYVSWNQSNAGRLFVTFINHGNSPGTADIQIPWKNISEVISSRYLSDRNVQYKLDKGWLKVELEPYAAITFCEK